MNAMSDSEVVQHVMRYKVDYYRILMVERTATVEEIKSAYKKMALKCHPDKNKHPQAVEAFKLVGTAHTTLSDATKRRIYDRQGAEGVQRHESGAGVRRPANGARPGVRPGMPRGGQRDFFEEFFGGGGGGGPGVHYQFQGMREEPIIFHGMEISPSLLMIAPILIFLLLALLLQSSMTDIDTSSGSQGGVYGQGRSNTHAPFSLTPSYEDGFVVPRKTSLYALNVDYFTTRRWNDILQARKDVRLNTELAVLRQQRDYLEKMCKVETIKKRSQNRKDTPEVCTEYDHFQAALG